jgi:hypothetical protein
LVFKNTISLKLVIFVSSESRPTLFTDELRNASFSDDMARAMLELTLSPDISYSGLVNFVGDGAITVHG